MKFNHVYATKRGLDKISDIEGQRFGKLVAVEYAGDQKWLCRCDCGTDKQILAANLMRGNSKTCGCSWRIKTSNPLLKGPEHRAWRHAKERCYRQKCPCYPNYGGRGITVCEEWRDNFFEFYKHVGPRPHGTTLDRIDNNKGYEPGNVRWATFKEQVNNRRIKRIENFSDSEIWDEFLKRFGGL